MVHLAYVMGVSSWVGPEIAAMPEGQAFLRGACSRGGQATALVPFDTYIVEVGVGQGHVGLLATLALVLAEGLRRVQLVLPGGVLLRRGGPHCGQEGLRSCTQESSPTFLHLSCGNEAFLGPPTVTVLLQNKIAKRREKAGPLLQVGRLRVAEVGLLEKAGDGLN